MARHDFRFPNTCPKIDNQLNIIETAIENQIEDIIMSMCPLISRDTMYDLRKDWTKSLLSEISQSYELVRETNQDIRKAAEIQISELGDNVDDLRSEVDDLKNQVNELAAELNSL